MAVFNTNQVRHAYVATTIKDRSTTTPAVADMKNADIGTLFPIVDNNTNATKLHFVYKNAVGTPLRSDLIDLKTATYYTIVNPKDDVYTLKAKLVTLKSDVNEGAPVAGQDYIVRIQIKNFVSGMAEDDYFKHGMVHAYSGMTTSDFYNRLALSFYENFSREVSKFFTFWVKTGDGATQITEDLARKMRKDVKSGTTDNFVEGAEGVIIQEAVQPWDLGRIQEEHVEFEVYATEIVYNGDELLWGTVVDTEPNTDDEVTTVTIPNTHRMADLEYFTIGERGDIYRKKGWPFTINTKYLINADDIEGYYALNLHYAFVDDREGPQRSEKDITIITKSDPTSTIGALLDKAGVKKIERVTA